MRFQNLKILSLVCLLLGLCLPARAAPNVAERLGFPKDARLLLIHADDFGVTHAVNRATEEALLNGWVTSASVIVPAPWFPEVARFAHEHPEADIGVHLALNSEWSPYRWATISASSRVPSLLDADGYLHMTDEQVLAHAKPNEVEREFRAQIDRALKSGIQVSHLDTHCNPIFRGPKIFATYFKVGSAYHIPQLQEQRPNFPGVVPPQTAELVDRVVQMDPGVPADQWLAAYKKMLTPLGPGVYQLLVHVGYDDDEQRAVMTGHPDWGSAWRQHDFDTLRVLRSGSFSKSRASSASWRTLAKALR